MIIIVLKRKIVMESHLSHSLRKVTVELVT